MTTSRNSSDATPATSARSSPSETNPGTKRRPAGASVSDDIVRLPGIPPDAGVGAQSSPDMTHARRRPRIERPADGRGTVLPVGAPKRKATYAELCEVPDHLVAEILDGELVTSPRPASPHARAAMALGGTLFDPFDRPPGSGDRPGGWWILFEPELHLGEDVLVPDLAGWRRERLPVVPNVVGFTLPPDWVCEVISPATPASTADGSSAS